MSVEIKIPSVGESITEVIIAQWFKQDGEFVEKDEPVVELETDKINQELTAPEAGTLRIGAKEGDTLSIGDVAGHVEPGEASEPGTNGREERKPPPEPEADKEEEEDAPSPAPAKAGSAAGAEPAGPKVSSVARKVAEEHGIRLEEVEGRGAGGRITKDDVLAHVEKAKARRETDSGRAAKGERKPSSTGTAKAPRQDGGGREVTRERLSSLRKRIAQRLVEAQQTAAMLTTFNEVDMTAVMSLRKRYKEDFEKRHGVGLGLMSFFLRASVAALQEFPRVNAYIEGDEVVYHHYCDIGVAVGTDRGLVVPVIRNVESLGFAGIERGIREFAAKAREGGLTLEDLTGGTFTISNGGVYGSMLSTPILNPPQSAILGMHNIQQRPMAIDGEVKIRPMMYLALSYDHRIIDGKEAVSFLVRVKEGIETPERLLLDV